MFNACAAHRPCLLSAPWLKLCMMMSASSGAAVCTAGTAPVCVAFRLNKDLLRPERQRGPVDFYVVDEMSMRNDYRYAHSHPILCSPSHPSSPPPPLFTPASTELCPRTFAGLLPSPWQSARITRQASSSAAFLKENGL
ncbi:hypothetical protein F4823DRAFT_616104 [Ustulina deusta]|nr:hypothetical protein F4823DRAFT_616104 [Ustulina deusta]